MPQITTGMFSGGAGVTVKDRNDEDLEALLRAAQADSVAMRAAMVALLAKLDADAGVTDADYAATLTPAALTLTTD